MSDLIAIAYPDLAAATLARDNLAEGVQRRQAEAELEAALAAAEHNA
jgi:hypothetical protein